MRRVRGLFSFAVFLGASVGSGCAVPHYDVPYTEVGQPTVKSIVQRIQCEIRDLVRDDPDDPAAFYAPYLLSQDFDVLVSMSIEVNDTGGLTPSLAYMKALSPLTSFTFSGNATLSESRDHTFTENLQFSVREIYLDWYNWKLAKQAGIDTDEAGLTPHDCPPADTNLSGTLGIIDFVSMAAHSEGLDNSSDKVFGGTIQFLVTKNVNSVGPTWTLVHFKGPGGFLNFSQINTDKITLAFAQGPNVGTPLVRPRAFNPKAFNKSKVIVRHATNTKAYFLLQQMLTSSINSQLLILQNGLQVQNGMH
jgi:hypothetical protein